MNEARKQRIIGGESLKKITRADARGKNGRDFYHQVTKHTKSKKGLLKEFRAEKNGVPKGVWRGWVKKKVLEVYRITFLRPRARGNVKKRGGFTRGGGTLRQNARKAAVLRPTSVFAPDQRFENGGVWEGGRREHP